MADRPNMGYSSTQANEMLMGLPSAMAKTAVTMAKKAKMGLGEWIDKKIIENALPKYGMDEAYPGELSSLKPISTEGSNTFLPFVKTEEGYKPKLPGLAADAYNTFIAPNRSMTDPNFNAPKEGVNMALNLMGGGAFGRVPPGSLAMNAYHGSPHRFPSTAKNPLGEFDPMKVGTGEGVQAYGTGAAYLAENPEVARQYKEQLTKGGVMGSNPIIETNAGNIDIRKATNKTEKLAYQAFNEGIETGWNKVHWLAENWTKGDDALRDSVKKKIDELDVAGAKLPSGSFYKVDLPDDRIAKMLDWDNPVEGDMASRIVAASEDTKGMNPDDLKDALGLSRMYEGQPESGSSIYKLISGMLGSDKKASEWLKDNGITGIKYLDGNSRAGDAGGTSNFVVFDPADMTILERNGMTAQDVLAQESKGLVPPVQRVAPQNSIPKKIDVFGNGSLIHHFIDNSKNGVIQQTMPNGKTYFTPAVINSGTGTLDALSFDKRFDTFDEAVKGTKNIKISQSLKNNQKIYSNIPTFFKGYNKNLSKKLIDNFGDVKFSTSSQSNSFYAVLPNGEKVRISDHNLPISYEGSDHDFRIGEDINSIINKIKGIDSNIVPPVQRVAPQDEALRLAQERAALPVEQGGLGLPVDNTPEQRAMAMGFDTDAYHGTASDISAINPAFYGSSTGAKSAKDAFFSAESPETAVGYANFAAQNAPVLKLMEQANKYERLAQRGIEPDVNYAKYDDFLRQAEDLEKAINEERLRGQNVLPLLLNTKKSNIIDAEGNSFSDLEGKVNELIKKTKLQGKDTAIIKNLDDDAGFSNRPTTHYGILNPDSVRSRFAAFDPYRKSAAIAAAMGVAAPDLMADEKHKPAKKNIVPPVKK